MRVGAGTGIEDEPKRRLPVYWVQNFPVMAGVKVRDILNGFQGIAVVYGRPKVFGEGKGEEEDKEKEKKEKKEKEEYDQVLKEVRMSEREREIEREMGIERKKDKRVAEGRVGYTTKQLTQTSPLPTPHTPHTQPLLLGLGFPLFPPRTPPPSLSLTTLRF